MQWTVAMIFRLTGESFAVTRFLMFLLGIGTLAGMFLLLRQLFGNILIACAGTWIFSASPVFFYYTMNPLPDNLALCGATLSLAFFFKFLKNKNKLDVLFSAVFISLSAAAKLPFIIFLSVPGLWLILQFYKKRLKNVLPEIVIAFIFGGCLLPVTLWYAWVIPTWHNAVVKGIFGGGVSVKQVFDILGYHLKEIFPNRLLGYGATVLLLIGVYFGIKNKVWRNSNFIYLATAAIAVLLYWIYEFNTIGIVHDYYMMPFLPILYIVATYGVKKLASAHPLARIPSMLLVISLPFITFYNTKDWWSIEKSYYLQDVFRYKEDLKTAAPKGAQCIILNDPTNYIYSYLIDKHGFVFKDDFLPGPWLEDLIKRYNIQYLYSDSRKVDGDPEVNQHFEKLIMERGSVKVFKLKSYAPSGK